MPELIESSNSYITVALLNGAFKNRTIAHHYGDTADMQSFTFYTILDDNKEKSFVPSTVADCRSEMDVISSNTNPILRQPQNVTVCQNANATFSVAASTECGNIHYQWKKNGLVTGIDSNILTLDNVQLEDNGAQITCDVSNSCGQATTNPVLLTVTPLITQQPQSAALCRGVNVTFTIGAAPGCGTNHYQWKKNGVNIGTDWPALTLHNVQLSDNNSEITCQVSNSCNTEVSKQAILNVTGIILQQPQNVYVQEGGQAVFSVTGASGCGTVHYQWKNNGYNAGTDSPTYMITNIQKPHNGARITCELTNSCDSAVTEPVTLNIVYGLNATAGPNGSVEPNSPNVILGGSQTFTASSSPNYLIEQWYLDGNHVQTGGSTYTIVNVTENHSIYVTFSKPIILTEQFAGFMANWLENDPVYDVAPQPGGDGIINFADFAVLVRNWAENH